MTKTKALYLLVGMLFTANIGLMVWTLKSKKGKGPLHERRHHGPKHLIAKKLNFSENQITEYEELIKQHRKSVQTVENKIRTKKNTLYTQLNSDSVTAEKEILLSEIGVLHSELELIHFHHFRAIKAICTEGQLTAYEKLTVELSTLFQKGGPKKGRKH